MIWLPLLFACPKTPSGPAPAAVYLDLEATSPALCVSPVADAGSLGKAQDGWVDAVGHLKAERADLALPILQQLEHPGAQAAMGAVQYVNEDISAARYTWLPLVDAHPEDPCLHEALALAYLELNKPELARTHANRAEALDPTSVNARYISALIDLNEGDLDGGASRLRSLLLDNPNHVGANLLLGALYLSQGNAGLALPHLERAESGGLEAQETLVYAYFGVGRLGDYVRIGAKLGWEPLQDLGLEDAEDPWATFMAALGDPKSVRMQTSMGEINCALFPEVAPVTVANFVRLARGEMEWINPAGDAVMTPLYDGTVFHRVIPSFMIQGGDPAGDGTGGPGYAIPDEFHPSASFSQPGMLAMANAGPNTGGSQFFVTEAATSHLNGRHTIFGQCDGASLDVVYRMARVRTDRSNVPNEPIVLESVIIE